MINIQRSILGLAILLVLVVIGCKKKEGAVNSIDKKSNQESEIVTLPFDVEVKGNISIPNMEAKIIPLKPLSYENMIFTPVNPSGCVDSVKIDGKEIKISDPNMIDGKLLTSDFGEIEIIIPSPVKYEIRVTNNQLEMIQTYLKK